MIDAGACVVVHLGSPREQVFGVVLSLTPAGIVVRGLALTGVDDWMRALASAESPSAGLGLSTAFYPMHRVDKIVLDEPSWGLPSVQQRFVERLGRDLRAHVEEDLRDVLPRLEPAPKPAPRRGRPRS